jgi:RNA methyltransferase, TrmH family
VITSTANPLVKGLARLRIRRHRDASGQFLIEGRRALTMADSAGVGIIQQLICRELGGEPLVADVPQIELSEAPFRKISVRQNPDGVIGVAPQLDTRLEGLDTPSQPLILLVESIEKPGNLGAMLRTADAVGVGAVIVATPTTDVHNPNVVQASQGALFTVPLAVAIRNQALEWLREREIRLVASTPAGEVSLWEANLAGPVAIAVGSEAEGVSSELLAAADQRLVIPMEGAVDSLNASVSAAVLLYEAARQRNQS